MHIAGRTMPSSETHAPRNCKFYRTDAVCRLEAKASYRGEILQSDAYKYHVDLDTSASWRAYIMHGPEGERYLGPLR